MAHRNAEKGKRWERWCSAFLGRKRKGKLGDHNDLGDLDDPDFIYECKDDRSRSPLQWWDQAEAARLRAGLSWSMVLAKHSCLSGTTRKPSEPHGWAFQSIEQWKVMRGYIRWLEESFDQLYGEYAGPSLRTHALQMLSKRTSTELADSAVPIPPGHSPDSKSEPTQRLVLVPGGRS